MNEVIVSSECRGVAVSHGGVGQGGMWETRQGIHQRASSLTDLSLSLSYRVSSIQPGR